MEGIGEAVGVLKTITLQGKSYKIGELTLGDYADYEQRARDIIESEKKRKLENAVSLYGVGNVPANIANDCLSAPTNNEITDSQSTIAGTTFLFHRALKKGQPEITLEQVRDLVHLSDLAEILKKIGAGESDPKNELTGKVEVKKVEKVGTVNTIT